MSDKKIECAHTRKCKWIGKWSDLKPVVNLKKTKEFGITITDKVCPKCGGKEFYEI